MLLQKASISNECLCVCVEGGLTHIKINYLFFFLLDNMFYNQCEKKNYFFSRKVTLCIHVMQPFLSSSSSVIYRTKLMENK